MIKDRKPTGDWATWGKRAATLILIGILLGFLLSFAYVFVFYGI